MLRLLDATLLTIKFRTKAAVRHGLRRMGFDLVRSLGADDLLGRRMALLRRHQINILFDVGANAGQYASTMRALGYKGQIVSFEPSSEAYGALARTARNDPAWIAVQRALGEEEGEAVLHLSANSQSSSLLPMLSSHVAAAPTSAYVDDEMVRMTTLAVEIERHVRSEDRLFVKIDTQGFEDKVLSGAGKYLSRVLGLQLEVSMVPLYDGQVLIESLIASLRAEGYAPMSIEPGFNDPSTGELLQADCIFFRPDALEAER